MLGAHCICLLRYVAWARTAAVIEGLGPASRIRREQSKRMPPSMISGFGLVDNTLGRPVCACSGSLECSAQACHMAVHGQGPACRQGQHSPSPQGLSTEVSVPAAKATCAVGWHGCA